MSTSLVIPLYARLLSHQAQSLNWRENVAVGLQPIRSKDPEALTNQRQGS